ncbi:creatininase family protein [Oscillospiraceae bacterium LTW-04]|nr:creatininase family protein [Oscillospiraceae bacterium MB24-C1]
MEYKLKNMSWTEFSERSKTAKTIIIPSGACEVYGPHLPLGSDILVAEKISELVAKEVNGIVAPCVEVGQSKSLTDFPGTIAISAAALTAVYRDIIEEFVRLGFKNFFVINTHFHNTQPLNEVMEDMRIKHDIRYGQIGWWQYIPSFTTDIFEHTTPHAHAGEAGTSVLMFLVPELVHMEKAPNSPNEYTDQWPTITKSVVYGSYTKTGTIGDATLGSVEKGRIAVERGVKEIAACIKGYLEQ